MSFFREAYDFDLYGGEFYNVEQGATVHRHPGSVVNGPGSHNARGGPRGGPRGGAPNRNPDLGRSLTQPVPGTNPQGYNHQNTGRGQYAPAPAQNLDYQRQSHRAPPLPHTQSLPPQPAPGRGVPIPRRSDSRRVQDYGFSASPEEEGASWSSPSGTSNQVPRGYANTPSWPAQTPVNPSYGPAPSRSHPRRRRHDSGSSSDSDSEETYPTRRTSHTAHLPSLAQPSMAPITQSRGLRNARRSHSDSDSDASQHIRFAFTSASGKPATPENIFATSTTSHTTEPVPFTCSHPLQTPCPSKQ
ncbi:hypothetical protein DFH08DRAFT_995254 [Mycena albidolilacea]|uniref:Uncharacterized protein n=1 Tax=Mycena albidolilacea TaxID=1033008 RepID=A0AAD7ET76_9AGAR|nr:hypothetical protein DFH08DRAFT_995254 [Mycena albidolilacea]